MAWDLSGLNVNPNPDSQYSQPGGWFNTPAPVDQPVSHPTGGFDWQNFFNQQSQIQQANQQNFGFGGYQQDNQFAQLTLHH
jgi:hypothetical protein